MILLIDNYDSFSYNLFQLIGEVYPDIMVYRNDKISIDEIRALNPEAIILSPGPGRCENAGICIDIVKEFYSEIPILGVCLGHQAICTADSLFEGLPNEITVGRYHSLSLLEDTLPDSLKIISKSEDDGEVMAVKHKEFDVYGLQFHPESILTPDGLTIIENFLNKV